MLLFPKKKKNLDVGLYWNALQSKTPRKIIFLGTQTATENTVKKIGINSEVWENFCGLFYVKSWNLLGKKEKNFRQGSRTSPRSQI